MAFLCRRRLSRLKKNSESQPVRDQQQRHDADAKNKKF
jgi:hypothetical protein